MKPQKHAVLLVVVFVLGWHLYPSRAADKSVDARNSDPPTLQVVSYSSGLTGFFEASSKTLYVYASDLKTPFMTVEIETLGEPLKVLKGPPQ